jgi:hypothetical protein
MFDYSKLRGRIVEKYGSISKFSEKLTISRTSVDLKLNNKVDISRAEILEWSKLLDINADEYSSYFFTEKLNSE